MTVPTLAVTLKVPAVPQTAGKIIPVTIEVRNVGDDPCWMVGVLDGSEQEIRYPRYRPEIAFLDPARSAQSGELPESALPDPLPLADMAAPLRIQDFRRLLPGQSFDPTIPHADSAYQPLRAFASFCPSRPGRYELRLTLSTDSQQDDEWLGIIGYPGQEEVLARLAEVPRLQIVSNPALIEVLHP